MSEPASAILNLLRRGERDAAEKLARTLPELDIFESAALGALEHLIERCEEDASCVNTYDSEGRTPLHLAASFGNKACVKELLRRGAQVDAVSRNPAAVIPLEAALSNGYDAIAAVLRAAGARGPSDP